MCMERDDLAITILFRHGYIFHEFNFAMLAIRKFSSFPVSISIFFALCQSLFLSLQLISSKVYPIIPNKIPFCFPFSYLYKLQSNDHAFRMYDICQFEGTIMTFRVSCSPRKKMCVYLRLITSNSLVFHTWRGLCIVIFSILFC